MRSILSLVMATALAGAAASAADNPNRAAVRQACQADISSLCAGIQPGGGRIRACLRQNKDKLSQGCRSAIAEAMQARRAARQQSAAPVTGPVVPN